MKCVYCDGKGIQCVERNSSLSFPCPDCNGEGHTEDEEHELEEALHWESKIKESKIGEKR